MNKNESEYFNTTAIFDEALIYLLEKKDIEYITVKEICNSAGVNRSTFYLHYEAINDLIEETMNYVNKKFINYFSEDTKDFIEKIKYLSLDELKLVEVKYLEPYLDFVKSNKKIFKASFNNPVAMNVFDKYTSLKQYILIPILERFDVKENERNYLINFYIKGIMAIVQEWIKYKEEVMKKVLIITSSLREQSNSN